MELLNSIAGFIAKLLQWWFIIMPWEQAIFVRRGKKTKVLSAGWYFRIPFIDTVYVQTTRLRMVDTPMQTISTKDGITLTIKSAIGYSIDNIEVLYKSLYHPEMTLNSMVMGFVGEFVRNYDAKEITPISIEEFVKSRINAMEYGLTNLSIKITTFAAVKTFRLIQDGSALYEGLPMESKK